MWRHVKCALLYTLTPQHMRVFLHNLDIKEQRIEDAKASKVIVKIVLTRGDGSQGIAYAVHAGQSSRACGNSCAMQLRAHAALVGKRGRKLLTFVEFSGRLVFESV